MKSTTTILKTRNAMLCEAASCLDFEAIRVIQTQLLTPNQIVGLVQVYEMALNLSMRQ